VAIETMVVGEMRVARAEVPEATRQQRRPLVYAPGLNLVGGADDRLLAETSERLAQLCRLEVIGVNPPGVGSADGVFDATRAIEAVDALISTLGPEPPILLGFGLIGLVLLAASSRAAAIATIDPLVDPFDSDDLARLGVRVGTQGTGPLAHALATVHPPASWLVISQADVELPDPVGLAALMSAHNPEVHRIFATEARLHADPRTWALVVGWIERAPWQQPAIAPAPEGPAP
jgi:pimeloyl-ACP methyl ester carboxylesterase